MTILVLGSSGLLGTYLVQHLNSRGVRTVGSHRLKDGRYERCFDATNSRELSLFLSACRPHVIINLVAMTDVVACERKPTEARLLNSLVAREITRWIKECSRSTYLIHISTDHVYGGEEGPHSEASARALNVYAKTKFEGEEYVLELDKAVCLRTSFIGMSMRDKRKSFTDWLYEAVVIEEKSVMLYGDVLFSPVSMKTLAWGIEEIIQKRLHGLLNFGSRSGLTKDKAGRLFLDMFDHKRELVKTISYEESADAQECFRPRDMRMDVSKIEGLLESRLPDLQDEVK